MKKISIRNYLILILLSQIALIIILFGKNFFGTVEYTITLKNIKYMTIYKDWSELNTLSSEYSYSSIVRTEKTRELVLNRKSKSDNEHNFISDINEMYKTKVGIKKGDMDTKKILLTNCAFDKDGNELDVIITISDFLAYTNNDNDNISLRVRNVMFIEGNQVQPICNNIGEFDNPQKTQITKNIDIGDPMFFNLHTHRAQVKFTVNYYYHPRNDSYPWTNQGKYKLDISKMKPATIITKVNGMYTDIDVLSEDKNNNKGNCTIFTGKDCRNEGICPIDKTKNTVIYYNKNMDAKVYKDKTHKVFIRTALEENNNGIMISSKYERKPLLNEDGMWYGASAFMTNDNLKNGEMSFYYGGDDCGISYSFMSPVPYNIPDPTKKCDKKEVTRGDELTYEVTQYMPNMVGQNSLNFEQVYKSAGYSKVGALKTFEFSDQINSNLDVIQCEIFRNGYNISTQFTIKKQNNKITASANTVNTTYYSNALFTFKIKCRLKSYNVRVSTIPNTGQITIQYGTDNRNKLVKNTKTVYVNVYYKLQGNVWIENREINGKKDNYDFNYNGMVVQLLNSNGNVIKTTRTDANGMYIFNDKLAGDTTYYIRFSYNGQIYQSTYKNLIIKRGKSSGKENETRRADIQNRFATIRGSPSNYIRSDGQYNVAYGINQKIVNLDTNELYYINNRHLVMIDILRKFDEGNDLNSILNLFNVGNSRTRNAIINYINDCSITAQTDLVSMDNDSVDFGVYSRPLTDLAISNEIVSASCIVNGKLLDQSFNEKAKQWNANNRVKDNQYNGNYKYILPIKSADYLFNATDYGDGENSSKNLQVYVRYKITIKNNGSTNTRVDYINDWLDYGTYTYDDNICRNNSYIKYGKKQIQIKMTSENSFMGNLQKIVITGENNRIQENNDYLAPGDEVNLYITFKVKNDSNGKLIIEEGKNKKIRQIGKRNVCEIGQYETFYKKDEKIPDYIDNNGNLINKNLKDEMAQGTIDINSNPGNLQNNDFIYSNNNYGGLNYYSDRIENDTDQSELVVKISNATCKIAGTVFEDNRTNQTTGNAIIGNGVFDNNETKINGVTVELIELVRSVDPNTGIPTGDYVNEKIWNSYNYDINKKLINGENANERDYYSGIGKSKIILNSEDNNFRVSETNNLGYGQYMFDNIPSGDFIIRFKYGDTYRTVLTNDTSNEVNRLLNANGFNAKSYNGNDYKSTIYEANTTKVVSGYEDNTYESNLKYNSIRNNYDDTHNFYNNKNYINTQDDYNSYKSDKNNYVKMENIKDKLNFFDLNNISENDSDAKDVYYYRIRGNEFSKNLSNHICEVLDSFEKKVQCGTNEHKRQEDSINELINNTSMVAQTGLIDTTRNDGRTNNVNLGLVERAKAQVVLNQEVSNIRVTLANRQILYDVNKTVHNLYYGENGKNEAKFDRNLLVGYSINENKSKTPSLIQAYIDDELMEGANLEISYKITAENKSEVDFNDNLFYYTGEEKNVTGNLSKLEISEIVNYVSNSLTFDSNDEGNNNWNVITAKDLIDSKDLKKTKVNNIYNDTLKTYNTLLISPYGSGKKLVPEVFENNSKNSKIEFTLKLKSMMGMNENLGIWQKNDLTYNNLMEIIQVKDDRGRRLNFAILGNQEMANQSVNPSKNLDGLSGENYIQVKEIDAASSQKVVALPPTGKNKNYLNPIIIGILADIIIIILGIWQIKIYVLKEE